MLIKATDERCWLETRGSLQQQMSRHNSRLIAWHFTRIAFGQSTAWAHISINSTTVWEYLLYRSMRSGPRVCLLFGGKRPWSTLFFLHIIQACSLSVLHRLSFINSLAVKLHHNIYRSTFFSLSIEMSE